MTDAANEPLRLTIGCTFSDRIEALLDGRVMIDGVDADIRCMEAQPLFATTLRDARFDIAELSMASHIAAMAAGRQDYAALPIFLSRSFRHSNIYVRTDRGIDAPSDLAGKTIGLIDYQQTAALWLRGLLDDEYGVSRQSIRWITAGLHKPVLTDRMPMRLPAGIRVERSPDTLDAMLVDGRLDAVISPTAPNCFARSTGPVDRLWPDYRSREVDFWRRRGVFPIMHVVVVRRNLLDRHPTLAARIFDAFDKARELALGDLGARDFPKVSVPWVMEHAGAVRDVLGTGLWSYGIEQNRETLEIMLRYAEQDGLAGSNPSVAKLFWNGGARTR